jgi:hypothetical protein
MPRLYERSRHVGGSEVISPVGDPSERDCVWAAPWGHLSLQTTLPERWVGEGGHECLHTTQAWMA